MFALLLSKSLICGRGDVSVDQIFALQAGTEFISLESIHKLGRLNNAL